MAFLAEKMCKNIKENQPLLGATDKDVLCVKLAGLLHDIGHGPYSHLYEAFRNNYLPKFLQSRPKLNREYNDCKHLQPKEDWSHEQSSLLFMDSMLEELGLQIDLNNLDQPLVQIGDGIDAKSMRVFKPPGVQDAVLTSRDFVFIKECIVGKPLEGFASFVGRQEKKLEWMYDIVNNRHSGLDVDKIDYFARDHSRTIGKRGIDMKLITDARVAKGVGKNKEQYYMICYPDKHIATVMNFFKHRMMMHCTVYQHKTNTAVEALICDLLCHADPYFRLRSLEGEEFPISRAYLKSDFLLQLDDSILSLITHTTHEKLAKARELCNRYRRRQLYKCAVNKPLNIDRPIVDINGLKGKELERARRYQKDRTVWIMNETEIHEGMVHLMKHISTSSNGKNSALAATIDPNDFIVTKFNMHHGAGDNNPLMLVRFFDKMSGEKLVGRPEELPITKIADESEYQSVIPSSFRSVGIRVLVRDESKKDAVNFLFNQWYETGEQYPNNSVPRKSVTSLYVNDQLQIMDDDENDNEDKNSNDIGDDNSPQKGKDFPAQLTQDFVDFNSDEEDEYNLQMSQSPIPVRTRRLFDR